MSKYYSTKTYGNDRGLSCCFRQWRSTHSHCSLIHGYSIGVRFVFECDTLDARNWVMDFGGLKEMKEWLEYMFDHTMLIAHDDPYLPFFQQMANLGNIPFSGTGEYRNLQPHQRGAVVDLRVVDGVGCEKFAEMVFHKMEEIMQKQVAQGRSLNPTARIKSVEVFEHDANSAIYER